MFFPLISRITLHDDEVLAVHREASGTEFRVYVKDGGDPSDQVTLLVPLSELGDMSVGNGYLAIVLSKGPGRRPMGEPREHAGTATLVAFGRTQSGREILIGSQFH